MLSMLTCKELARLASTGELEEVGWMRRLSVRLHLLACRHCRQYLAQLSAIRSAAREAPLEPADAERVQRLEEKLLTGLAPDCTPPDDGPA